MIALLVRKVDGCRVPSTVVGSADDREAGIGVDLAVAAVNTHVEMAAGVFQVELERILSKAILHPMTPEPMITAS
jgi:hypothetical protein